MNPKLFSAPQEGFESSFWPQWHVPQKAFPWNRDSVGANARRPAASSSSLQLMGVCAGQPG